VNRRPPSTQGGPPLRGPRPERRTLRNEHAREPRTSSRSGGQGRGLGNYVFKSRPPATTYRISKTLYAAQVAQRQPLRPVPHGLWDRLVIAFHVPRLFRESGGSCGEVPERRSGRGSSWRCGGSGRRRTARSAAGSRSSASICSPPGRDHVSTGSTEVAPRA